MTNTPNTQGASWEEEFNQGFPIEFFATTSFDVKDPTEYQFVRWQEEETKRAIGRKQRVRTFIRTILSKERAEGERGVVELIKDTCPSYESELGTVYRVGHWVLTAATMTLPADSTERN